MIYIPAIGTKDVKAFEIQTVDIQNTKEEIIVTGNIDEIIIEGVSISLSLIRKNNLFKPRYMHIHYVDYDFLKEGSSAFFGTYLSIYMALNNIKTTKKILVTGELDIYGSVCQIGGMEEKYDFFTDNNYNYFFIPNSNYQKNLMIKLFPFQI